MKKNNFFIIALLSAISLLSVNGELLASEPYSAMLITVGVAGLVTAKVVTNSATYKTYSENNARHAQEKEKADNPYLNAQELPEELRKNFSGQTGQEKIEAFEKHYEEERKAYAAKQQEKAEEIELLESGKKVKTNDSYKSFVSNINDDYYREEKK